MKASERKVEEKACHDETGAVSDEISVAIGSLAGKLPGGFFAYRADEREEIIYVNDVMLDIFGCETEEEFRRLIGETFDALVYPDDLAAVQESIRSQISEDEKKMDYVEYRIRRKDGEIRWVDDYGRHVNIDGVGDVFLVFIRDVTDERASKEEKLNMELALEREKHLNEAKSSFLFSISHDIRTPMNAIMGFTELARRHADDTSLLHEYLDKLDEANRHLLALIDDLLEMSRLDYDKVELHAKDSDLRETLSEALDMFRPAAAEKGIDLVDETDIPDDRVFIDVSYFTRIIENLLSNAVKFTPAGGRVTLRAHRKKVSESGYARYEFSVEDTGVGMNEDFMRKVWDAFERENTSTETGLSGTGLGLAIAKRLVDIMGGTISAASAKGTGSKFTVDLPIKLVSGDGERREKASIPSPKADGEHRILIVEDIDMNRILAETLLSEAGFLVESVPDGCDAVEAVASRPAWYYDLVLMDIQMPVMNGYEATRAIRALGREDTASLPIVALSANAREEDRMMSRESGMNAHVAKPFDIARLVATVNEHIATSRRLPPA